MSWMHFAESEAWRDPNTGARTLSVAVLPEGVTFAVAAAGEGPRACTVSWTDFDLLVHAIDVERGA